MAWYIARSVTNKVVSVNDDAGLEDIYRYIDEGWTIYRIAADTTPGQFVLIPQTLTNVTTEPVTIGGDLTDA